MLCVGGEKVPREPRYFDAILSLISKLKLEGCVVLDGKIERPEEWFRKIDIYISNSFWETMNTSMVEAMACGRYALSHFWDSSDEILPADNIFTTTSSLKSKVLDYYTLSSDDKMKKTCEGLDFYSFIRLGLACFVLYTDFFNFFIKDLIEKGFEVFYGTCEEKLKFFYKEIGFKFIDNIYLNGKKEFLLKIDL